MSSKVYKLWQFRVGAGVTTIDGDPVLEAPTPDEALCRHIVERHNQWLIKNFSNLVG